MATTSIPETTAIDSAELQRLIESDDGVRLLDVRTGGEFESVHIPGSYNVPLDTLGEHARELAAVDRPLVLICQSGGRATKARSELEAAGKHTLRVLEGGMNAWTAAGGDVVRGESTTWAMDRQVRLVAGSIVLAAVVGSVFVPPLKWLAAGVGAGLTYSAVSDTCAMANLLGRLPYNRSDRCDIQAVLDELDEDAA